MKVLLSLICLSWLSLQNLRDIMKVIVQSDLKVTSVSNLPNLLNPDKVESLSIFTPQFQKSFLELHLFENNE